MKNTIRRFCLIAVALVVCSTTGMTLSLRYLKRQGASTPYLGVPQQRKRIDKIISDLKGATFDDSVARLVDNESYYYPGYDSERFNDQENLEQMLSNRNCVKIFQELERMGADEREVRCKEMFHRVFKMHADTKRAVLRRLEEPREPQTKLAPLATHFAVGAAMFATANYGSTKLLCSEFSSVDGLREELERRMAGNRRVFSDLHVRALRMGLAPDNRFQFNVLYMHAARLGGRPLEIAKEAAAGLEKREIPIVSWDAHTTWFDIPRRMELIPMDTSKGVTTYTFYGWPLGKLYHDEEAQRGFVQKLRKAFSTD